jgi:hypothetical protein
LENIQGRLPVTVDIIRKVAGLALPLRCTLVQGIYIGSCTQNDFCSNIFQFFWGYYPSNCPPELADLGIDCNCPFNIPVQNIEGQFVMDVIDFMQTPYAIMAVGDFDLKYNINNASNQHVACFRFLFTMSKA